MEYKQRTIRDIATPKQINAIRFIENACDIDFCGSTQKDVQNFIKEWLPKAQFMNQIERAIGSIGVQTAEVHFPKPGKEHLFPDDWSVKRGLAEEQFKGDILRGRNPVDALCDLQERVFLKDYSKLKKTKMIPWDFLCGDNDKVNEMAQVHAESED